MGRVSPPHPQVVVHGTGEQAGVSNTGNRQL